MKKQQGGFTLIELVVVIVILGILAATAVPRFVDLSGDAEAAACQGAVGALLSAAVIAVADNTGAAVDRDIVMAGAVLSDASAADGAAPGVITVSVTGSSVTCDTPVLGPAPAGLGLTSD